MRPPFRIPRGTRCLRQTPETARAPRFLGERFLHKNTSHLNSGAGRGACFDDRRTLYRPLFSGSPGRETHPSSSASRAASATGQSLSAKREQGVPGGAADYHKILNESPWVVPSLETKHLAEPAQPRRVPPPELPGPVGGPRPASISGRTATGLELTVFRQRVAPPQLSAPPLVETPTFTRTPSPAQPQSPPHACLLFSNPEGLHPPSSLLPSSFFRPTSPRATCAELHTRPPPHFSVFPEPRPPPSDSITCPHPAPRFSFNQIQASAPRLSPSQLAPACSTGLGASTSLAHQDRCCAADLATGLPRC